ncbi:MAG: DUF2760 domain-containing protein [Nannocystaceae bacterium]
MERLALGSRIWMAITCPWRILLDTRFASRVHALEHDSEAAVGEQVSGASTPASITAPASAPTSPSAAVTVTEPDREPEAAGALQLLGILQREGRLIDFLQEDVSGFSDAEIGAAARVVHDGCVSALKPYVTFEPLRTESEGGAVQLEPGFDAERNHVTGNVVGAPPFRGKLAHHGWQTAGMRLPQLSKGRDPKILSPAEVEL